MDESSHDERKQVAMKMLILGAVCAAGLLFNTGCASCCKSSSCSAKPVAACTGACCADHATCAKCCTDEAGCAKCCHKS